MNCVFISPNHPRTHWMFTNRLKANGVNVLGIGDCPYDELNDNVRDSLTEYYYVQEIKDYNQVFRAVAFFSFKYGKISSAPFFISTPFLRTYSSINAILLFLTFS